MRRGRAGRERRDSPRDVETRGEAAVPPGDNKVEVGGIVRRESRAACLEPRDERIHARQMAELVLQNHFVEHRLDVAGIDCLGATIESHRVVAAAIARRLGSLDERSIGLEAGRRSAHLVHVELRIDALRERAGYPAAEHIEPANRIGCDGGDGCETCRHASVVDVGDHGNDANTVASAVDRPGEERSRARLTRCIDSRQLAGVGRSRWGNVDQSRFR